MRRPLRVLGVAAQLDSQGITRVPLRWFASRCLYSARLYALERIANLFVRVDEQISLRRNRCGDSTRNRPTSIEPLAFALDFIR